MEYMTTWKLLRCDVRTILRLGRITTIILSGRDVLIIGTSNHLFTADDTGAVGHRREFFL